MIYIHPRTLHMLKTMQVVEDAYVTDVHMVKRTLKERLFTLPWAPLTRYKAIYCPTAYITREGVILVSPKTYALLQGVL